MIKMTPVVSALGLLLLVTTAAPTWGLCTLRNNGTHAQCHYLEDIKFIQTYDLKSLRVSSPGKHLSASVFGNITTLEHLDLSHGKLRHIEPGTFSKLRNLVSLDLSHNHLTHLGRGTFEGSSSLHALKLHDNYLVTIPVDMVDLKGLKLLDLSSNKIHCSCKTLRIRDTLSLHGVITSNKEVCTGPGTLEGVRLAEPKTENICRFESQDSDPGMQQDQPQTIPEGSGELGSGEHSGNLEDEDIPVEKENPFLSQPEAPAGAEEITPNPLGSSLTTIPPSPEKDEGPVVLEEVKETSTVPMPTTTLPVTTSATNDSDPWKNPSVLNEGSGDEDDGSGFGSSGPPVPPITWDNVSPELPEEETGDHADNATPNPISTTRAPGIFDGFFGLFPWGSEPTTIAPPTTSTEDSQPEEEGFMIVPDDKPAVEEPIVPNSVNPVEGEKKPNEPMNEKVQLEPKPAESPRESSVEVGGSQVAGASATSETKKGMGSYVVLGVLLGVLAALIGVAAYKGDFCRKVRKTNTRGRDGDVENATELKDLKKSLLENANSVQPKISSNGSKPESMPLVTRAIAEEIRSDEEPTAKFIGSVPESSADPVKPPRKSFSPTEPESLGTNGKIASSEDVRECPRTPVHSDHLVNGKNDRDSICSLGSVSNHRLSNPSPSSPGAQRVKITMQDNPDSVPKTPLLITRTKAGENLVKTP